MAEPDQKLHRIASGLASAMVDSSEVFEDPDLSELTVEEAKQVQSIALAESDWPIGAWKAGASNFSSRDGLGLDSCFIGAIPQSRVMHSPAAMTAASIRTHLIECEVAIRLDIEGWVRDESDDVRPHLISVHPAIELPDTRYALIGQGGTAALLADFGAAGGALIGGGVPYNGRASTLETHKCILTVNDETVAEGSLEALISDPVDVAALLKPEFVRLSPRGGWGEYILLGGMTPAVPIKRGDAVRAEFDRLGALDLHVE